MGSPKQPAPPPPPDYAAANREAVEAQAQALPFQRAIESASRSGGRVVASLPSSDLAGVIVPEFITDSSGNRIKNPEFDIAVERAGTRNDLNLYDFSGLGEGDLARSTASSVLGIQEEFGDRFIQSARRQLEASDPEAFKLRRELGEYFLGEGSEAEQLVRDQLLADLRAEGELTSEERRRVEQDIRGSQAARGNILGEAPTAQETAALLGTRQEKRRQAQQAALAFNQNRLANQQAFVFGQPLSSQFGNLSGAQSQAAPFIPPSTQVNPFAGQQGTQFAQQTFGGQIGIFNTQSQAASQQVSPFAAGLGLASSAFSLF